MPSSAHKFPLLQEVGGISTIRARLCEPECSQRPRGKGKKKPTRCRRRKASEVRMGGALEPRRRLFRASCSRRGKTAGKAVGRGPTPPHSIFWVMRYASRHPAHAIQGPVPSAETQSPSGSEVPRWGRRLEVSPSHSATPIFSQPTSCRLSSHAVRAARPRSLDFLSPDARARAKALSPPPLPLPLLPSAPPSCVIENVTV